MNQKEILERLRSGADVAYAEDVHLHVGPEVCKAAADLIERLARMTPKILPAKKPE